MTPTSRLSQAALTAALLLAASALTGCGALAAAANPKVAWALTDPAPMTVVVRRADAADKTSKEVDRLLTATPAGKDTDWVQKVAPDSKDAASEVKALVQEPMYAESHARVVPAEVWRSTLHDLTASKGEHPSLLAAVDEGLGDKYRKIMEKKVEIAGLNALIAQEEAARDDKATPEADKNEHETNIAKMKKMADASEKDVDPLQDGFLKAAKEAASKAPADVREKLGAAFVNLRQAVEDADIANSAAAVRYPLAVPSIVSSVKSMVPVILADIIEEKTGKRPNMSTLKPDVSLDGTKVNLTLNGLDVKDLGKLKIAELTKDTIVRTGEWVGHALGLLGTIAANKELLSFEEDVLDAVLDGFSAGGWKAIRAAKIPAADDPAVASATAKVRGAAPPSEGLSLSSALKAGKFPKRLVKDAVKDTVKDAKAQATKAATGAVKKVVPAHGEIFTP